MQLLTFLKVSEVLSICFYTLCMTHFNA